MVRVKQPGATPVRLEPAVRPSGFRRLLDAIERGLGEIFGSSTARSTPTGQLSDQVQRQGENAAAAGSVQEAVELVAVMRGFVPGTNVPQSDPQKVAEFRRVMVPRNHVDAVELSAMEGAGEVRATTRFRSSRESLEQMLDQVWDQRAGLATAGSNPIYSMYCAATQANPRSTPKASYLGSLATIAQARPKGAVSNLQSFGGGDDSISPIIDMYRAGEMSENSELLSKQRVDSTFFRFQRANWKPQSIRDRVYINAKADAVPDLMGHIVRTIVDNPHRFPGVEMAKCSGPQSASGRAENIVIYTSGADATRRVVDEMARYQRDNGSAFMDSVPMMTEQIGAGIALGQEPAKMHHNESFGSLRARLISQALGEAVAQNLDRARFGVLVRKAFREAAIDPQRPHQNMEMEG